MYTPNFIEDELGLERSIENLISNVNNSSDEGTKKHKDLIVETYRRDMFEKDKEIDLLKAENETMKKELSWMREITRIIMKAYDALELLCKQMAENMNRGKTE